jgi:hypothetical protein
VQIHFFSRDEIFEKLHGPPHCGFYFQAAAYLSGRPAEEVILINSHGFLPFNDEKP